MPAAPYELMKRAILKVVPNRSPGLTVAQIHDGVLAHLSEELFPGGAKSGWWVKTIQLDLEAKGILRREKTKPLRLCKARHPRVELGQRRSPMGQRFRW